MILNCPFCNIEHSKIILANDLAVVIRDGYPLTTGHSLIIPKRHLASLFEASQVEQRALLHALQHGKAQLDDQYHPDGYNIGINDGAIAGQTVMHLHIHLIPRYQGDCQDPRGGVRWIFPEKAVYW